MRPFGPLAALCLLALLQLVNIVHACKEIKLKFDLQRMVESEFNLLLPPTCLFDISIGRDSEEDLRRHPSHHQGDGNQHHPWAGREGERFFYEKLFSSEISCHLCFWKTLKLVFSPPLLWFCTYWTIPNFWCIELWIPFEKSVTFFEFDVVHQSPRRDGACNPNPAIIWIQRIKLFLLVQTCSWKSFLSLSLSFDQSFLTLSLSQSPLQYWMFSVRSYTVLKRSGKNCQIQPPFSSLSLKSKRIWTLSFRHNIYGILYLDHGGVWEAEPQYVHLWGLWVNVQCTMQVIWGYSVHMYHAGYLGHNRVWDTVCQGTSQQHQHQPDLQSCITQECSRFFSWQFTINLWR